MTVINNTRTSAKTNRIALDFKLLIFSIWFRLHSYCTYCRIYKSPLEDPFTWYYTSYLVFNSSCKPLVNIDQLLQISQATTTLGKFYRAYSNRLPVVEYRWLMFCQLSEGTSRKYRLILEVKSRENHAKFGQTCLNNIFYWTEEG